MAKNTKPTCFQYEYSAPLSEDQIKEIANEWVKEPGWYEFDYNDFISCIRAIERAYGITGDDK